MPAFKQDNRKVRIRTPFGDDVLLVKSLTGSERLGRPFQYELVLASETHELDYKKIIGQNVTVFVDKGDKEPRFFNGHVCRFAQTKYEEKLAEYHATVVPWLWFLSRSSDCRIFQNLTIPEILKQVFEDHGFSDIITRLQGSYRKWDYCVQYRETAYDFVSRLMEEEGIYYYFKQESERHFMVLCDSPVSHKQFAGYEELLYRPASASVQEALNSWAVRHEVQSASYVTTDFDFASPRRNSQASSFRDRGHAQGELEEFDYLGEQSPFSEGERYSKLRLEERQARHETYSGEGTARGICTGVRFVLKGHPRKDFEKEYLTTGAEYVIQTNSFETTAQQGEGFKYNVTMTATLLDDQFRPPRVTPKPIVHGPQTAIVVGPAGEKIYTDQYGRVKVQFHWDRRGTKDENSSCWLRVSQAWAGKPQSANWGDMALPHVGDEVIVECLEGDPDRPIITGRVYNQANMPPLTLPANKDRRIWMDDYGNQMVFDATSGDEHIRLHSPHHNSGITFGRSVGTFTESNAINTTMGDNVTVTAGIGVAATLGLSCTAVAGANMALNIGADYTANFAAQSTLNLGPQYSYTRGGIYAKGNGNDNKTIDGGLMISAKKSLNFVASAQATAAGPGTAIIHADADHLDLTVGKGCSPTDIEFAPWFKAVEGILAFLPLLTAGLAGGAGAYVDAYNTASTDNDTTNVSSTASKQSDFMIAAGTLEALSLVSVILFEALSDKAQKAATHAKHADFNAGLQLKQTPATGVPTGGSATLAATTQLLLGAGAGQPKDKPVSMLMNADMTLENKTGEITIKAGTNGEITMDNAGNITIKGASVKVTTTGTFDANKALTVSP